MPHYSSSVGPFGPLLTVFVGLTAARRSALALAKQPVPMPVVANLLIDTGASHTSICDSIVQQLNLQPTGSVPMHTPSTGAAAVPMNTYDVDIAFAGIGGAVHSFTTMPVIGSNYAAQGIDGLLGRDALSSARLMYSGPDKSFWLSF